MALEKGHPEVARLLMDAGADVNAADDVRRDGRVLRNVHVCMCACVRAWVRALCGDERGLLVSMKGEM